MCNVRHKFGKLGLQSGNIICSKVLLDDWAWLIWSIQCGVVGFHNEWMNGAESDVTSAGDWVALYVLDKTDKIPRIPLRVL